MQAIVWIGVFIINYVQLVSKEQHVIIPVNPNPDLLKIQTPPSIGYMNEIFNADVHDQLMKSLTYQ